MKQFPRIYSLSTLGIRQHQLFDYKFHPFRTDFVGESGCGKSMIADMLQLVFVGSEVWSSPTESVTPRTVDGMVLRTGRGTEIGYIFLNIQLGTSEFIVIGAYLESSSKNSHAFMIHKSWDEENLQPFTVPLTKENLLKNKKILPLDELKKHIESQDLVCHSFQHKKKFHKILYNNKLLSFDLSENEKLLRDYAVIIQSFSRGKALELTESNSLKSFLFGNAKSKELNRQFKAAVQELQAAVHEYGNNKTEISQIIQKQKDILELQGKKEKRDDTRLQWLTKLCVYNYQDLNRSLDELKDVVKAHLSAEQYLEIVGAIIAKEIEECNRILPELDISFDEVNTGYKFCAAKHTSLEEINAIMEKAGVSTSHLKKKYKENRLMFSKKKVLEDIEKQMTESGVRNVFKRYDTFDTSMALINFLDDEKKKLTAELEEKQMHLAFADITDKNSVGYWALKQKRSFSINEESVIMHFKGIKTTMPNAPKAYDRYIPRPENLLKELSVTEPDDKGFWLYMKGIKEYVELVDQQSFTEDKLKSIEQILASQARNLKQMTEKLKNDISEIESLRTYVLSEGRFNDYLSAYRNRTAIESYNFLPELNVSEEQMNIYLDVLANEATIEKEFKEAYRILSEHEHSKLKWFGYFKQLVRERDALSLVSQSVNKSYTNHPAIETISPLLEFVHDKKQLEKEIESKLRDAEDKISYLSGLVNENRSKLNRLILEGKWSEYQGALRQKQNAWQQFASVYFKEPDSTVFTKDYQSYPVNDERDFEVAKRLYEAGFQATVDKYHLVEGYKFKDDPDILEISKVLLPEAFKTIEIKEEAIIDTIARYLSSINEKNRELSKRKLQKIQDILEQVKDEVSISVEFAKRIDLFLNSQEREITGGYRARLKQESSKEFPRTWIDNFIDKLGQEGTLFSNNSLVDQLADDVSLQEKLIHAFHICGGSSSVTSVESLLDPNSYIDLFFSMESKERGLSNKGSTGQTYTAVALLCIARLSIINREAGSKHHDGIRFMPIDEAEGLGSNYDMLSSLAKEFDYQIISLSISPLGKFRDGKQYLYMLHKNMEESLDVNNEPFAILCEEDKKGVALNKNG